ncbi:copper resistance protein B [Acinetobacter corruptisaponis]|uniref:Copper resistance protein B n=1 Tax=Acinetobacter corruptisaponis TaxID=3045147 RepID=A0ABY8S313_9GAMM|nr:copper resistance protein B [Acinetobacter sp. KCTC 92772]WHP05217.1 copper resistance protein B [Acinetobacter sp. KCTC 92772]
MYIIKPTPEIKRHVPLLLMGGMICCLSAVAYAHEEHNHMTDEQPVMQMDASSAMQHEQHQVASPVKVEVDHAQHDHHREHGGQIYQAASLENAWTVDDHGRGSASSKLKTWVGTDEHKVFIKAHVEKAESERTQTDAMALYSRSIADFWDVQVGARHQYQPEQWQDKNQWSAVVGLHGLAPYFFETKAYLYAGQDQRWQFSLETSRDVLFTQKLIAQPYLNADLVLNDQSKYAQKSGVSKLQTGVQIRYEINKKVMPFIDLAYAYHQGNKQTAWQMASGREQGGLYGAGLTLKF